MSDPHEDGTTEMQEELERAHDALDEAAKRTPLQIVERGLNRLAYKRALGNLLGATQQWAAQAKAALDAAAKADPDGTFSDEETDAAAVAIQETFRAVVGQSPALKSLFLVVAGVYDASVPE